MLAGHRKSMGRNRHQTSARPNGPCRTTSKSQSTSTSSGSLSGSCVASAIARATSGNTSMAIEGSASGARSLRISSRIAPTACLANARRNAHILTFDDPRSVRTSGPGATALKNWKYVSSDRITRSRACEASIRPFDRCHPAHCNLKVSRVSMAASWATAVPVAAPAVAKCTSCSPTTDPPLGATAMTLARALFDSVACRDVSSSARSTTRTAAATIAPVISAEPISACFDPSDALIHMIKPRTATPIRGTMNTTRLTHTPLVVNSSCCEPASLRRIALRPSTCLARPDTNVGKDPSITRQLCFAQIKRGPAWPLTQLVPDRRAVATGKALSQIHHHVTPSGSLLPRPKRRGRSSAVANKYLPLIEWLSHPHPEPLQVAFAHLDALIDGLPPSARRDRTWWANTLGHPHSAAWLEGGWIVQAVELNAARVTFVRGVHQPRADAGTRPSTGRRSTGARPQILDGLEPSR